MSAADDSASARVWWPTCRDTTDPDHLYNLIVWGRCTACGQRRPPTYCPDQRAATGVQRVRDGYLSAAERETLAVLLEAVGSSLDDLDNAHVLGAYARALSVLSTPRGVFR